MKIENQITRFWVFGLLMVGFAFTFVILAAIGIAELFIGNLESSLYFFCFGLASLFISMDCSQRIPKEPGK